MERLLKRRGHSVTTAENVASALAAAEDNGGKFDAVICDLGLPDGSGHDLMAQLRDEYGLRGIAVSGYGMEEDVRRSTDSGFSAHLTKPIEFKELRDALALVLPAVRRQQRRRCLREPLFTLRGRALRRGGACTPAAGSGFRSAHGKPFVGQIIWSPRPPNINRRHGDVAVRRGFCSTCGSPIFWDSVQKDWIGIAMGAFDLPTDTKLGIHVSSLKRAITTTLQTGCRNISGLLQGARVCSRQFTNSNSHCGLECRTPWTDRIVTDAPATFLAGGG